MSLIHRENVLSEIEKAKSENRTFDYDSLTDFIKAFPEGEGMIERIIEKIQAEIKPSDELEKVAFNSGLLRAVAIIRSEMNDDLK